MKTKRDKVEEAYLSVRPTIFGVCASFVKEHGGEFEDIVSEAHEHFMFIYHTHDPEWQTLEADVQYRLRMKLLSTRREILKKRRQWTAMPDVIAYENPKYFDIGEFMDTLSEEAKDVIKFALNPNPDVEMEVLERGDATPHNIRSALRQYLKDLRWTTIQIRNSFSEIKHALMGTNEEK